jgi:hypothetical protein
MLARTGERTLPARSVPDDFAGKTVGSKSEVIFVADFLLLD